jgi:hypothetical protein
LNCTSVSDTAAGSSTWNHMPAACGAPLVQPVSVSAFDAAAAL